MVISSTKALTAATHDGDSMAFSGDNIWDIAGKMCQAVKIGSLKPTQVQNAESALIFVGAKDSGKSTLIHKFLERQEPVRPTLGLEYSYGRKTGRALSKDVCHIWEVGGASTHTQLLATPFQLLGVEQLLTTAVIIVVDLSRPEMFWVSLQSILTKLHEIIDGILDGEAARSLQLRQKLLTKLEHSISSEHTDRGVMRVLGLPWTLVGTKYDLVAAAAAANDAQQQRRLLCAGARYLAHLHGGGVLFHTIAEPTLTRRLRELFTHYGFGTTASGHVSQDHNKPLAVPAGADCLSVLMSAAGIGVGSTAAIHNAFVARFPQQQQQMLEGGAVAEDPAADPNYRHASIDQLRAEKHQQLEWMRADSNRKRQWADLV